MNPNTQRVLQALRAEVESHTDIKIGEQWIEFGSVYLDNVQVEGLNSHQIAGYYSALEASGHYVPEDTDFGLVRLAD